MRNSFQICDDEWMLKKTEGTYFLRIGDLVSKIEWAPGTYLDSQKFVIGSSKFKLRFFPNNNVCSPLEPQDMDMEINNQGNRGSFGVFLYNLNSFDVLVDLKLTMGRKTLNLQKQFLRENECIGKS